MPAAGEGAGVHRPERGRGQGEERPRVLGDGVGHVLGVVSGESGAQQVEGVGGVAVRAGRADRGAAVAARGEHGAGALEQHGAVAVQDAGGAAQVDGCGAAAGGLDLGAPLPVVRCAQAGGDQASSASSPSRDRSGGDVDRGDGHRGLRVARVPRAPVARAGGVGSVHAVGGPAGLSGVGDVSGVLAQRAHRLTGRRLTGRRGAVLAVLVGPGGWALQPVPARRSAPGWPSGRGRRCRRGARRRR